MSTPASPRPSAPASAEPISPGYAPTGPVLSFRTTAGWGNVPGNWAASVSTQAATFEAWIRTAVKDSQTIVLGSNLPGATPRVSVGGDRISVYWNTGGARRAGHRRTPRRSRTGGGITSRWCSTRARSPSTRTAWPPRTSSVGSAQQAAGDLQLGAGFGATTGFVGQMYGVRVWSVARTAQEIAQSAGRRWAAHAGPDGGRQLRRGLSRRSSTRSATAPESVSNVQVVTTDLAVPAGRCRSAEVRRATSRWTRCQRAHQHRRDAGVLGEDVHGRRAWRARPDADGPPRRPLARRVWRTQGDDKLGVVWLGQPCSTRPTPGRFPMADGITSRWCSTTAT